MAKSNNMKDLLKQRMSAAQQVSEMEIGNRAYESLIDPLPAAASTIRELPVDKLRPFFITDIGFHPYSPEKLRAFSQQLLDSFDGCRDVLLQPGFQSADHHDRFAVDQLGVAEEFVQSAFDDPVGHGFEHIGLPVFHVSDAHVREFQLPDA